MHYNRLMFLFTVQLSNELFNHTGAFCKQASSSSSRLVKSAKGLWVNEVI